MKILETLNRGSMTIGPLPIYFNLDQCNGTKVPSPFDVCNSCNCEDGLVTRTCTEIGCSRGRQCTCLPF